MADSTIPELSTSLKTIVNIPNAIHSLTRTQTYDDLSLVVIYTERFTQTILGNTLLLFKFLYGLSFILSTTSTLIILIIMLVRRDIALRPSVRLSGWANLFQSIYQFHRFCILFYNITETISSKSVIYFNYIRYALPLTVVFLNTCIMLQLLLTVVLQKQLLAKYFNRCYELVSIILGLSIPCVSFGFYKPLGWTSYIMEVARLRDSTAEIFLARVGWVFAAAFASFVIAVFVVIKLFPVWRNSYTLSDIGHPDENGNIGTYSSINRNNSSAAGSGGGKRKRHNSNREDILVLPEFRITKDMRLLQQTVLEHKCSEDSVYTATTVEMMKQASSLSSLYPNDLEKQAYEIGYHHSSGYGGNGMRMPKEEEEVPQRQLQHQRQQHHNAGAKRRKVPLKSVQTKQQLAKLRRSILRVMVYPIVTFSVELAIIVANMMGVHYGTLVCINLFRAAQGIFEFFLFLMNPSLDEVWPILLKPVKAGFSKFIN